MPSDEIANKLVETKMRVEAKSGQISSNLCTIAGFSPVSGIQSDQEVGRSTK
jgi:hypothetical protein